MTTDGRKKILIFSQAPADIKYTICLYEEYVKSHEILICVVNVFNDYRYLKSLNLDCGLLFIPLFSMKNPFNVIRQKCILARTYKEIFRHCRGAKIYFNSKDFDFGTYYFIGKLYSSNTVYFYDFYKHEGDIATSLPLRNILQKLLLSCIVGNRVSYIKMGSCFVPRFEYRGMGIKEVVLRTNPDNLTKYMFDVPVSVKRRILLYESNGQQDPRFVDYGKTLEEILRVFADCEFEVFIKPHPRLGYSRLLTGRGLNFIESYIPAEMIKYESFQYVIGFATMSITSTRGAGKTRALSLMDLIDYKSADDKASEKESLLWLDDTLYFVKTLDELRSILTGDAG